MLVRLGFGASCFHRGLFHNYPQVNKSHRIFEKDLVTIAASVMAYDKEAVIKDILELIEKEEITFFDDIPLFIAVSRGTLYAWKLNESDEIKEAITVQRCKIKKGMRKNWVKSENATLQISAYKLMATPEEHAALTMQKVETKSDVNVSGGLILELDGDCKPIKEKGQGNPSI